jgi:cation:H+ antiporter
LTESSTYSRSRKRDLLILLTAGALPLPWMLAGPIKGLGLPPEIIATLAGLAILGGAMLISWAAELSERDIPQAIAILVMALVAVLPEYAVDLHFAWAAGTDPSMGAFAVANMTGANRLLIGIGWAAVVLISCWRSGSDSLEIHADRSLEVRYLLWTTLYSFVIPLSGTINLFDAFVLFSIFALYVREAMGGKSEEVEILGPAGLIDREFGDLGRRTWAIGLFVVAAFAIFVSAEPFADSLVEIGRSSDMDEFLLVQWVAPLASESPEFLIAILFAWKMRGSLGIGTLISSKVNQWTLLVGGIPIAFAISSGGLRGLPLDERQTGELILTSAQSLLATVLISDLNFSRKEALLLAALFLAQFMFTSTEVRYFFVVVYIALAAVFLFTGDPSRRKVFLSILKGPVRGGNAGRPGS